MTAASERLAWLDHARAAGILLVVVGHAIRSIDRTGLATPPILSVADTAIYSFHMPLFFLLAGMAHAIAGRKDTGTAARAALVGIIWPYLLWSAVWFALKNLFAGASNAPMQGSLVSILWSPVDHFWFLYVLLIVRVMWIGVEATGSALARRAAILVPLVVAFIGAGPADGVFNAFLAFWAAFYGLGVLAGGEVGSVRRPWLVSGAAVACLIWASILIANPDILASGFGPARTLAAILGSAALVGAVAALVPAGRIGRWVAFVGEGSLAIFLTHTLFGAAARVVLAKLGILTPATLVVAATVAGMVGPLVLYAVVLKIGLARGRPLARWLGLGTQRRSHWIDLGPAPGPAVSRADRAS